MKKFIGHVNGVEYTDKKKFNEAVRKALLNDSGNFVISSYETEMNEPENEPKFIEKKNYISENDFTIERESDKETVNGNMLFKIPEGLKDRLRRCDNKDEVEKMLYKELRKWEDLHKDDISRREALENDIKRLKMEIERRDGDATVSEAAVHYYRTLLGYLKSEGASCRCNCAGQTGKLSSNANTFASFARFLDEKFPLK